MSMPSGDSPQEVKDYYLYLQGHHQNDGRVETWHVDWFSLAWLWGFAIVLVLTMLWWIWQYRTTKHGTGIYPVDRWGGYTSELAGPATRFFLLITTVLTLFGAAIVIGHIVWGQKF